MAMTPERVDYRELLHDAIGRVYRTFRRYPFAAPSAPDGRNYEHLEARPLRRLTPRDLAPAALHLLHPQSDVLALKHFLPRLLELAALDPSPWTAQERVTARLHYAGWWRWPVEEQEALREFLAAWWEHTLATTPAGPGDAVTDRVLCAIAQAEDDLGGYLGAWQESVLMTSVRHLLAFLVGNIERLERDGLLANPFWEGRHAQMDQVIDWLMSADVVRLLAYHFNRNPKQMFPGEAVDGMTAEVAYEALRLLVQERRAAYGQGKGPPSIVL